MNFAMSPTNALQLYRTACQSGDLSCNCLMNFVTFLYSASLNNTRKREITYWSSVSPSLAPTSEGTTTRCPTIHGIELSENGCSPATWAVTIFPCAFVRPKIENVCP